MTNLKRVPFDYERWKADGSRLDRLVNGFGDMPIDIAVAVNMKGTFPICLWYENEKGGIYMSMVTINGKTTNSVNAESSKDLFLLIEPRTRIELNGLVAVKSKGCWHVDSRSVAFARYYKGPNTINFFVSPTIAQLHTILSLIKLIQDEEAEEENSIIT